jgi:proteasome accessory factor B
VLSFSYLNEELQPQCRALEPFAVTSRYGHWYIFGNDLDRKANRLFRLDRVSGELKLQGKSGAFEIPADLDVNNAFANSSGTASAIIFLRDGRGLNLRSRGEQIVTTTAPVGWKEFKIEFRDRERFIEEILWYGNDVIVSEPADLRIEILNRLRVGVATYG